MQGLELTAPPLCSKNLPPAQDQPSSPPPPQPHYQIIEPEDTTGQARKRTISNSGTLGNSQVVCRKLNYEEAASIPSFASSSDSANDVVSHSKQFKRIYIILLHISIGTAKGSCGTYVFYCAVYLCTHCYSNLRNCESYPRVVHTKEAKTGSCCYCWIGCR